MKTLLTALAALVLAAPALAAAPSNDNRADAQSLPSFPSTAHGSTVDATLERLDPQVSRCGRIDGTVWYEIEAAPDGTIVATVQASGQLAPVVRIYRRNPSSIEEVSCGSAPAGGKVVASVGTVRGAGYLILVGRRPGAPNGEFDLRADLVLPPDNDERGEAEFLRPLPATVRGSTLGATSDYSGGCSLAGGTVWYRVKGPATGRLLVQLSTGERDGVVAAFRRSRSEFQTMGCAETNKNGHALLGFGTKADADYLIAVGDKIGSGPGDFVLTVRPGDAPERLPGRALPQRGAHESVHGVTDVNDVWSVRLRRGTMYRISFNSQPCAAATLRRANVPLLRLGCGGYATFTPGPDGGGRYALEVRASTRGERQAYRLRVVAAGTDDVGVGVELSPGSIRGRLTPRGVDVRDLYHFDIERLSEVRIGLARARSRSFSLTLLDDKGNRIAMDDGRLRRRLNRGRYVVAVQGAVGTPSGSYRLALRMRVITATAMRISGERAAEVAPGTTVSLECPVSPAPAGGRVELQIDRFDTLTGWHFHRIVRIEAGATVSWRPPAAGRWRVRARYLGTRGSAPSRSGYAYILVARPIG